MHKVVHLFITFSRNNWLWICIVMFACFRLFRFKQFYAVLRHGTNYDNFCFARRTNLINCPIMVMSCFLLQVKCLCPQKVKINIKNSLQNQADTTIVWKTKVFENFATNQEQNLGEGPLCIWTSKCMLAHAFAWWKTIKML